MSIRKQQIVNFPLSTTNERKVRVHYKKINNLTANTSEEKVFNSIGIHTRKTAYEVLGELYNIDIEKKNNSLVVKRGIRKANIKDSKNFLKSISNVIDLDINVVKQKKKTVIKLEKLSPFIANWFKRNPNQMMSLKLGSTKADVILPFIYLN